MPQNLKKAGIKYKEGGMVGMPKYSNNPRVEQGRTLKYGGSCGKVLRGKNLRRSIK